MNRAKSDNRRPRSAPTPSWLPLFPAFLVFIAYCPSLYSDFVYDARLIILREDFVTSVSNIPSVLSLQVLGMKLILGSRPGQLLYLMLIALVSGKNPFGYHLCSNLLHSANVALLYVLIRDLIFHTSDTEWTRKTGRVHLIIATVVLIFGLHPIVTEAVTNISYSSDLLVAFFTFIALLAAIHFRATCTASMWIYGLIGTASCFLAVCCKESGIATSCLLVAYWFLFRKEEFKPPWFFFLGASSLVTAIFLAMRFSLAPVSGVHAHYIGGSLSGAAISQPRLWVFMMGKLIWPVGLSANYAPENLEGISPVLAIVVLVVVLAMQGSLAFKSRMGAVGVLMYWLALLPVSNFVPFYDVVADRFYYLPLAGVALQVASLLLLISGFERLFWSALSLLWLALIPLTFLSIERESIFKNEITLWSSTLQTSRSAIAYHNLGEAYLEAHRPDLAIPEFQETLQRMPNSSPIADDLGVALMQNGQIDDAVALFQEAIHLDQRNLSAYNHLGITFGQKGELDAAIAQFNLALQIDPNYPEARQNLEKAEALKKQAVSHP